MTTCPYVRDDLRAAFAEGERHFAMPPTAPLRGIVDAQRPKAQRDAFSRGWKAARDARDAVRTRDRRFFAAIVDVNDTSHGITVEIHTAGTQPFAEQDARRLARDVAKAMGYPFAIQTFESHHNPHTS